MTIEVKPEQQRMIDVAVRSGYRDSDEVISAALAMLLEDLEDGAVAGARTGEQSFSLDEVEAELRSIGKLT
jgi:Arc/MetJ-type ribon-helix-helix transcriptional regulator